MNRFSSFFVRLWTKIVAFWKARSVTARVLLVCSCVILLAFTVSIGRSLRQSNTNRLIEKRLYGESIGRNGLRYKHGSHIFNPETGKVLVDSIEWLHVTRADTIGILAKNNRRAYINLNNAELITPLNYDRAWQFACDRGIMQRNDSIFIFRRDGSLVNNSGFKSYDMYEYIFFDNILVLNSDYDHVGMIDTAGNWVLEPIYSMITPDYHNRLYNTKLNNECIVYDRYLKPILRGAYKSIEVDYSEGLIATEYNGIQRLFDYDGKLVYQVIFKSIEEISYNTHRKDKNDEDIIEPTDCFVYVDYNGKRGLMDKYYHVLTPPLFHSIEAQTKHVFFASFGEYSDRFGTLIDDHGKALR